ncbi:hypothetical protein OF83DRAFT_1107373 [Amylostereum chailletii]|nr:hypothetical protein OF83DRAFT_1107373 [Amylostereum chailletii]
MLAATSIMYLAAAAHWALDIFTIMKQIQDPAGYTNIPVRTTYAWSLVNAIVTFTNFWYSDVIVIWRACILWRWDRRIIAISALLLFATIVLANLNVAFYRASREDSIFEVDVFGFFGLLMSLVANLWATCLIGIRAWQHRRSTREHLSDGNRTTAVQSIMALLVESGILYCVIWAMFIISKVASLGNISHFLVDAVPQLTGIYPTVIIVLVCFQKTHCDRHFTYDASVESRMVVARRGTVSISHRTTGAQGASVVILDVGDDGRDFPGGERQKSRDGDAGAAV